MRQSIDLSQHWRFHLGEAEKASYQGYDDRSWEIVTLPHDWSVASPFDPTCSSGTGYLPGGIGWYRKPFTLPQGVEHKRVYVTFGGVYQHSRCYINSHYLGLRAYGYSTFTYELTGRVKAGENMLCVRAEHMRLADSRWFTGAGIYRGVTVTIVEPTHAQDVFAYTVNADASAAEIAVEAQLTDGQATFTLYDVQGNAVACALGENAANTQGFLATACLHMPAPQLWSAANPYLYELCCTVTQNGIPTDEQRIPFGVRTLRFDPNHGFALNGVSLKLKGVCLHHDAGVLGAAVPLPVWQTRLQKLQAAGCNAIRFSHNPVDPAVLTLCDQLGLLVICEAFDEWEGCKNKWCQGHNVYPPQLYGYADDFPQWYTQDLTDMVRVARNHACVMLWSIGNEIDYPNDPYVHASFQSMTGNNDQNKPDAERRYDACKPDASRLPVIARALVAIVKQLDRSRPVTLALAYPELSNLTGLSDTVDVAGYNYKEHLYAADHAAYPNRVIFGSENSVSVEAWLAVKHNESIAGQFLWTGADFLGEAQGWPVRISQAGLLDTANHEKPLYYQRKALWTDTLCAKLATSVSGNSWDETFSWGYAAGETVQVACYTNAMYATLYSNDQAMGTVTLGEDARALWQVPYQAGTLRVVCQSGSQTVEDTLATPATPAKLVLRCGQTELPANGIATVEIAMTDDQGTVIAQACDPITIHLVGDGALLGIENGDPRDLTPFPSATRPLYRGLAVVYLRVGTLGGTLDIHAWTRSGLHETLHLTCKS